MCMMPKASSAAAPRLAATDMRDATAQADAYSRMRRLRAGAAANVLTSPRGIPATPTLGGVAA